MKTIVLVGILILVSLKSICQQHSVQTKNQLCFDIGLSKTNKQYPNTTINFKTALHDNFIYSIRIRSYNTFYFYSNSAYDISPQVEYFMHHTLSKYNFLVGFGVEAQYNLKDKFRNTNSNLSIKPMVSATVMGSIRCLRYQIQSRFTLNDHKIGVLLLPEVAYRGGNNYSIFTRYELGVCKLDNFPLNELKQTFFIGVQWMF